jgi:hypothetical protein
MEVGMGNQYLSLPATGSRMEAILHHRIAEALLLKDHVRPVQPPLRTQMIYRVEVVKMQTNHKTMKEIQEVERSRETLSSVSAYVQIPLAKNHRKQRASGWWTAGDRLLLTAAEKAATIIMVR